MCLIRFFFPRFFFFFFEAFNDSVRAVKSHFETNHADTHTLSHTHTHTHSKLMSAMRFLMTKPFVSDAKTNDH